LVWLRSDVRNSGGQINSYSENNGREASVILVFGWTFVRPERSVLRDPGFRGLLQRDRC
jgi:hypothetical protein